MVFLPQRISLDVKGALCPGWRAFQRVVRFPADGWSPPGGPGVHSSKGICFNIP